MKSVEARINVICLQVNIRFETNLETPGLSISLTETASQGQIILMYHNVLDSNF